MAKPTINIVLKNAGYPSGRRPILMVVSFKNERRKIPLGHTAHPDLWDRKAKRCTADDPDAEVINGVINEYLDYTSNLTAMLEKNRILEQLPEIPLTAAEIEHTILKKKQPEKATKKFDQDLDFFVYADRQIELARKGGQFGTAGRYRAAVEKYRTWRKGKCMVSQMTLTDLKNYHYEYLLGELKNGNNTAHVSVRNLKTIYNRAVIEHPFLKEYTNPFKGLDIKLEPANNQIFALSWEDIKKLDAVKLPPAMSRSRDIFLFCYWCMGIRVSDAISLKWSQVSKEHIFIKARKTKKPLKEKMRPNIKKILDRYKGVSPDYVFGLLDSKMTDEVIAEQIKASTAFINKCLKKIAAIADIQSVPHSAMRSHLARHTLAHHVYADTMNIQLVKAICQHDDIRITENYIGQLGFEEVSEQMDDYWEQREKMA
jgi:integrase